MTPRGNGTPHSAWSNSTEDEPTPTLTSQTFAHAQGLNATSYLQVRFPLTFSGFRGPDLTQSPSESDAQDLIQKLKKAFALTRIGQESVTSSRQAEAALTALDQALDLPDKDHPFASLAPLELVPYLATLLTLAGHTQNDSQARLRNHARNSLILLVERASSAREVHHALLLRMARAGKRSAERADDDEEEELDRSAAFFELSVLIQLQADAIRRIRTKRLVPFLRAISNASKSVLQRVSTTEAIEEGRVADVTEATLLQAMAEFISSIIEMETLDSEVLDVLRDFLLFTLAQLASSPPLDAVLAECALLSSSFFNGSMIPCRTYFRRLHPRFGERLNQRNLGTQQADAEAWQTVKVILRPSTYRRETDLARRTPLEVSNLALKVSSRLLHVTISPIPVRPDDQRLLVVRNRLIWPSKDRRRRRRLRQWALLCCSLIWSPRTMD